MTQCQASNRRRRVTGGVALPEACHGRGEMYRLSCLSSSGSGHAPFVLAQGVLADKAH